jgi:hypothetical protein
MRIHSALDAQSRPATAGARRCGESAQRNKDFEQSMPRSHSANESRANESHGGSAGKKKLQRPSAGRKKSQVSPAAETRARAAVPTAGQVSDLAWAGAHAQAIEVATAALSATGLSVGSRLDLLDLRAESFIAQGDLERAGADADAMLDLAERARTAA